MNPEFIDDRANLLEIFPAEIWECIFDTVGDPNDLLNCAKASTLIQQWLQPRRIFYMFHQVLRVLDKERFLSRHDTQDILRCRLVCSKWKFAVNNFLEIRQYHFKPKRNMDFGHSQQDNFSDIAHPTYFRLCDFPVEELANVILPEVCSPLYNNYNPFPSRTLEIVERPPGGNSYEDMEAAIMYRIYTQLFLDQVGHHFWHAVLDISSDNPREYGEVLSRYLKLMPNLRSVYVMKPRFSSQSAKPIGKSGSILDHAFPYLKNLELLSTDYMSGYMLNSILQSNPHVETVEIFRNQREGFQTTVIHSPKNLSLSILDPDELLPLPQFTLLETLQLNMRLVAPVSLAHIFSKVETYCETLQTLSIKIDVGKMSNHFYSQEQYDRSRRPLNLPMLRRLEIMLGCHCSLDFLLGLKSLEYLSLHVDYRDQEYVTFQRRGIETGKEIIDFYTDKWGTFLECNIWEMMTRLREVELVVGNYTINHMGKFKRA